MILPTRSLVGLVLLGLGNAQWEFPRTDPASAGMSAQHLQQASKDLHALVDTGKYHKSNRGVWGRPIIWWRYSPIIKVSFSLILCVLLHAKFIYVGKLAGASYAILKDGKLVAMETMGYQDLEKKVPLTDQTIFRVFSQSKPVGTAGFLTLIDEVSLYSTWWNEIAFVLSSAGAAQNHVKMLVWFWGAWGSIPWEPKASQSLVVIILHT